MADSISPEAKRSEIMSHIRSRGNKATELVLAKLLRRHGISGWRRHLKLPGTPDFAFPKFRVAIFVDGCFWHGCPRCYRRPKTNRRFWDAKVARNRARDRRTNRALRIKGWKVLRIWGHSLESPERTVERIIYLLNTGPKRCDTAVSKR